MQALAPRCSVTGQHKSLSQANSSNRLPGEWKISLCDTVRFFFPLLLEAVDVVLQYCWPGLMQVSRTKKFAPFTLERGLQGSENQRRCKWVTVGCQDSLGRPRGCLFLQRPFDGGDSGHVQQLYMCLLALFTLPARRQRLL